MRDFDLIRRADDLHRRSLDQQIVTHTGFLTPAEQYALVGLSHLHRSLFFHGGTENAERRVAFFLPDYLTAEAFDPAEYLTAFHLRCRFAEPGHRDVLGSLLGLGIERWSLGDIYTQGEDAWFFCLPSIAGHIGRELTKIGRNGVAVQDIPLPHVPAPEREVELVTFSVSALRLDSILAGTFGLSRSRTAEAVGAGLVQLNYTTCLKPAAGVEPGDVFSLRGSGKAKLCDLGGHSRKGRLFVQVEKYR
ncbi:MAG: YlmH/Sll1252 family protein [Oscillospiraceae bacterium]|nr:YlmH/Sll1252 family protein [Oscillospiraceae bacterium]